MALIRKNNPIGLDFIIDRFQKKLFDKLSAKWNAQLNAYPRCYVLEDNDGNRTIEHYTGNKEYSGNLIVSEINKFFFTAEENIEKVNNSQFKTKISLYFILDIRNIYPLINHRCDNEVLTDVVKVIEASPGINKEYEIVTDYNKVFNSFFYEFDNIQPYYCFRIDLETNPFSIDNNC